MRRIWISVASTNSARLNSTKWARCEKYLLLGRGTRSDPTRRTHIKVPTNNCSINTEGRVPKEDYNFVHVDVRAGQPTKFTLNRFCWAAEPFATVELFGSAKGQ